ncbi:DUF4169 family protein [uncultured Alsobacter sp.]|uniref:DUF4169 family protein n=1 Tax=uncultured Alsobacter sp. TaxID=1748258 RepID=UPI0025E6B0C6|nr:DUF4169 family protein [uncultured Alsobacter sp.]
MTADIINLRKARKAKARGAAEARAAENRIAFGRTKAERKAVETEQERARRAIDGHRIGPAADADQDDGAAS